MKRTCHFLLLFLGITCCVAVQAGQPIPGRRLQALKAAYVTKQLSLTTDESEKFWPLYRSYMADIKKARMEKKDDVLTFEEDVLNIRKRYRAEFKKVLVTDERANKALTAERDFNNMLRKELQERLQSRKPNT